LDIQQAIDAILDRRLRRSSEAPLAVAFSGGGDSLALLLLADDWARARGRRLLVLTVDHGLNPASADWTEQCRRTAGRLGLDFRPLRWEDDKPATGLPAAARAARHALLADAAREAGARVILMGHTADDLTESAAMRAEGSTVSDPAEWGPSPAWPEGRDIFLLRPMLGLGREPLRDWLRARGETWIDDPANEDQRFARARARRHQSSPLAGRGTAQRAVEGQRRHETNSPAEALTVPPKRHPSTMLRMVLLPTMWGGLVLERAAPAAHIAAACLCAAGTATPPRGDRLQRLVDRLRSGETFTATLAGARIEASADGVLFLRDAGEIARGSLTPVAVGKRVCEPVVWDGRFEIVGDRPGLVVQALAGHAARLPRAEQRALKAVPASARPSLPVVVGDGTLSCPILAVDRSVRVRALALTRFEAAVGVVDSEPGV